MCRGGECQEADDIKIRKYEARRAQRDNGEEVRKSRKKEKRKECRKGQTGRSRIEILRGREEAPYS